MFYKQYSISPKYVKHQINRFGIDYIHSLINLKGVLENRRKKLEKGYL